jgi:uncharacterized protein (DUF362 family)
LDPTRVAIVNDVDLSPVGKIAAALEIAGFWEILRRTQLGRPADALRLVIKPEFSGYTADSPLATDPSLVEGLIDLLHDRGFAGLTVVGTTDSSGLWAENRDIYALSDLLGYSFVTPKGRAYDIVDLGDGSDEAAFPLGSALHGTGLSRLWLDADIRLVFAKNRTDEENGYALALDSLIGVLPLADKNLHYRQRRHPGDVVAALLDVAPVHFVLIDAITSTHGAAGSRAPETVDTDTLIATPNIMLADYIGALKMGIDPNVSRILARVGCKHPLPTHYTVCGALAAYPDWQNVPTPLLRSTQIRAGAITLDRLIKPWLQRLDPELFPLKNPLDARLNAMLAEFFADSAKSPTSQWLLIAANLLLGLIGHIVESYRTLFDKDALHHAAVPLGIDLSNVDDTAFTDLTRELIQLEPIATGAPQMSDGLRWRYIEDTVVFHYSQTLPIDFDLFVKSVDIARTIQSMNDYLGGVVVPLAHDATGRPTRQAERNIYLPQPNYLVLYHGKPIDVSKLEVVEYDANRHRLYWKTIGSENGSATYDDGIATFERTGEGTCITIVGRQLFTLPLFWQVFDLNLVPDIKSVLVTHAYRTFFDRTLANFAALVEGRDIRLGRPVDEPAPATSDRLLELLGKIGEIAAPLLQRADQAAQTGSHEHRETDADGFVHVQPALQQHQVPDSPARGIDRWIAELGQFIGGLQQAALRDLIQSAEHE